MVRRETLLRDGKGLAEQLFSLAEFVLGIKCRSQAAPGVEDAFWFFPGQGLCFGQRVSKEELSLGGVTAEEADIGKACFQRQNADVRFRRKFVFDMEPLLSLLLGFGQFGWARGQM